MPVMHYYLVKIKLVANIVVAIVVNNIEDKVDLPLFDDDTLVEKLGKANVAYKVNYMAKPIEINSISMVKAKVMEIDFKVTNNAYLAVDD